MAISYNEVQAEVLSNLEIGASDASRFKIDENMNSAQRHLLNILPIKYLAEVIKNTPAQLTSAVADYDWPGDFLRYVQAWVNYDAAITAVNPGIELTEWLPQNFVGISIDEIATEQYPFIDKEIEGKYRIKPTPGTTISNGILLRYVYMPAAMSASKDSPLNARFKDLIVYRTTQLSALIEGYNVALSGEYGELFRGELAQYIPKEFQEKRP